MKDDSICSKCNHRAYCAMSDEANNDNATIKGCYLYSERKTKTNADRIRTMTDEELAEWIAYRQGCYERQGKRCSKYGTCRDCWFDWLKEEASDD